MQAKAGILLIFLTEGIKLIMQKIAVIATKNSALSMFRPIVQLSKKDMVGSMIRVIDVISIVLITLV